MRSFLLLVAVAALFYVGNVDAAKKKDPKDCEGMSPCRSPTCCAICFACTSRSLYGILAWDDNDMLANVPGMQARSQHGIIIIVEK